MKGYMELDVCGINMWLLDLCTFRLELEVGPDNLVINAKGADIVYHLKIGSLKLHCNRIKPMHAGFLNVSKRLQNSPLEYLFTRHLVHGELRAAGQSLLIIKSPFNSNIPHLLYVFMVKQSASTGSYTEDLCYYQTNHTRLEVVEKLL